MSDIKAVINPMSMNTALYYYNIFMDTYALPHNYNGKLYTHSVPSSFVYNTIKDGCLWLITLIVGVAGYSIYFDNDTQTSRVLSLDFLERSGVKDPAIQYNSSVKPWEGLLSDGRSPLAPSDNIVDGVGLPYLNGDDLLPIYRADPLQAVLPEIDPIDGYIIYKNGVMQVKKYTLCISKEVPITGNTEIKNSYETIYSPIYGWGMRYKKEIDKVKNIIKECSLPLECINNNTKFMCYTYNKNGIYCLKTKFAGKDIKRIGNKYGKKIENREYMSSLEASPFLDWCRFHLTEELDRFYIPLYWMSKFWSPFISWRNGEKTNSLQMVMMASSIYTTGYLTKESMQGKSLSAIITAFLNLSLGQKEKEQLQNIVVNTQRIISILEFIKRI